MNENIHVLSKIKKQKYFQMKVVFIKDTNLFYVSAVRSVWIMLEISVLRKHL